MIATMQENSTPFSKNAGKVLTGEEVILARSGVPATEQPGSMAAEKLNKVILGVTEGDFLVPDSVDDFLPDEITDEFYRAS